MLYSVELPCKAYSHDQELHLEPSALECSSPGIRRLIFKATQGDKVFEKTLARGSCEPSSFAD